MFNKFLVFLIKRLYILRMAARRSVTKTGAAK